MSRQLCRWPDVKSLLWRRNLQHKPSAMLMRGRARTILLIVVLMGCVLYMLISASALFSAFSVVRYNVVILPGQRMGNLSKYSPLIFIGGVPRSGTTLIRAMLDAHPSVRCGEETRVIPRILGLRTQWKKSQKEWNRLKEAGVTDEVINDAISSFILQVIAGHGEPAERLCNKDPFTMKSAEYLAHLFPNSKFLLMIRDGRATVHSIISRQVTITGFDLSDPRQCLDKWNHAIKTMYEQCKTVGQKRCLTVYYEQLVLHPEQQLRHVLNFLNIPWSDLVLHHDKLIGKDISLSKVERSTDQVIKPVNLDALTKWVGTFSEDIVQEMASIAPMLAQLGYDPNANPPKYGEPDPIVLKNTDELHMNFGEWERRAKEIVDPAAAAAPRSPFAR
uniref:Protein-tyrosine sulfotransferase n=1 Tax=Wuchereria bancrofti TaxID=6293 RepID=A0AAF5PPG5_WUCBA